MFGQNKYLRLKTPLTSDGKNLRYNAFGQPMFREDEAPISALPYIKKLNEDLTAAGNTHLVTVWEEVQSDIPVHTGKRKLKTIEEIKAEMKAELLKELRGEDTPAAPAEKRSHKKKQVAEDI